MRIIRIRATIRAFQTRLVFVYMHYVLLDAAYVLSRSQFQFWFQGLYICYTQFIMCKGAMCIHHQSMVCMICDSLHAASVSVSITVSVSVL
jgi:hypothetical protein